MGEILADSNAWDKLSFYKFNNKTCQEYLGTGVLYDITILGFRNDGCVPLNLQKEILVSTICVAKLTCRYM